MRLAVTENIIFRKNDFRLTTNFTFDPEMNFSPHFHFNSLPEKEREREREREPRSEREGRSRLAAPTSGAVHDRDRQSSGAIDDRRSQIGRAHV